MSTKNNSQKNPIGIFVFFCILGLVVLIYSMWQYYPLWTISWSSLPVNHYIRDMWENNTWMWWLTLGATFLMIGLSPAAD